MTLSDLAKADAAAIAADGETIDFLPAGSVAGAIPVSAVVMRNEIESGPSGEGQLVAAQIGIPQTALTEKPTTADRVRFAPDRPGGELEILRVSDVHAFGGFWHLAVIL